MYPPTEINKDEPDLTNHLRLFSLSAVLISPAILYGLNQNFPTVALPILDLSVSTASWFGSVGIYVAPISAILSGIIIDKFGRRTVLILGILPSFVGWPLLYWNYNDSILLLGQMLNGLTMGAVLFPIQVYAGECLTAQNNRLRNIFMVMIGLSAYLGTTFVIALSNFLDYHGICIVSFAIVTVLMVTFWLVIPESPSWLYLKGRVGDAEWCEKKLSLGQSILYEKSTVSKVDWSTVAENKINRSSVMHILALLKRPDVYKPLCILCIGAIIMPSSGGITVTMYMINIISDDIPGTGTKMNALNVSEPIPTPSDSINANKYALFCSLVSLAGCLTSSFVLPVIGIKKTMAAANVISIVGLCMLTYSTLDVTVDGILLRTAAVTLLSFFMGFIFGIMSTVSGDLFPIDGKGFAGVPNVLANLSGATANKLFPYLYLKFNGYAYSIYAFISLLAIIYSLVLFPEIVGKSLNEINEEFLMKKPKKIEKN